MGRHYRRIDDDGPIGRFAAALREFKDNTIRDRQGSSPGRWTYRDMEKRGNYSRTQFSDAASGTTLPTWEVVEAYVTVLGADEQQVSDWRDFWLDTQQAVGGQLRKLGRAHLLIGAEAGIGRGRLRPVVPDLAEPAQTEPRPEMVRTYDDLIAHLERLRIRAGNPSLGELRTRVRARAARHDQHFTVGKSTLSEVFSGKRTPPLELLLRLVDALLGDAPAGQPPQSSSGAAPGVVLRDPEPVHPANLTRLLINPDRADPRTGPHPPVDYAEHLRSRADLTPWSQAWAQAEFNRVRPDLTRRRGSGKVVVFSPEQDTGPTADVLATMPPAHAAMLLAEMPPATTARLLELMTAAQARKIISAMHTLHGDTRPRRTDGPRGIVPDPIAHEGGISIDTGTG